MSHPNLETPASAVPHQPDYANHAWKQYTAAELGDWVHLLCKRALHRANKEKALKDAQDAQNYLDMLQKHVDLARKYAESL